MNKRLKTLFISLAVTLSAAVSFSAASPVSAAVDNTPDCDNVAIIRCGVFSEKAMREKAAQGDVPRVFNAFGIKQSDLKGSFVDGIVWRDGRITVDGKTVATGAMTAGRNYGGTPIPNTDNAGKYSTSKFVTEGQTAFVKMIDGKFSFAVIKSCGNPVTATPPKDEPKPVFECVSLTATKIDRTKYKFTAKATAKNGAEIEKYEFGFGDNYGLTLTEPTYTYTYKAPGTYTASVKIHVKANNKKHVVTAPACNKSVTIEDEDIRVCELATKKVITIKKAAYDATKHSFNLNFCKETPVPPVSDIEVCELSTKKTITIKENEYNPNLHSKTPSDCEEKPPVIPATGPAAITAGIFGSGSLGYGAYAYLRSRRHLIDTFLGRR